ncbi:L-lactate utilization operon repressor [Delftia tsuruhatensis]|uniref:FadR/GntR family transcriptional regulator n=1 Tax=Delftia tsuruhatensis TaxID=180282 RepID=UPI001E6E3555|nr:FadR/GntR family transcriptional regulator [Delftia tsuruhatensis]CAB5693826.1 L-lactate utilization operon repressor [Delftia tsuruhatensis]CAC9687351.1 L-lactate utilization operon repressor [Delftia tsuruhatensis]
MTVSFSAIQPGLKLADQVAQQLEARIRSGNLQPGQKLPTEAELVQQLEVSRTVVREAVSQLKSRNLVESRQGSGMYVKTAGIEPLDFEGLPAAGKNAVIQIAEVRRALEAEVAELAARRRSEEDMQRIHRAEEALAEAVRLGRDGVQEDMDFHRAIAQASGNPFLISTLDYLSQFLRNAMRITRANEARRDDFGKAVEQEHHAMVLAIAAGDPKAARKAAATHMSNAISRIQRADASFWEQDGERLARDILATRP